MRNHFLEMVLYEFNLSYRRRNLIMYIPFFIKVVLVLLLLSIKPIGFALDYTQWHLPEGATMRIGKGRINDITYSPKGTQFAVSTNIGVWIYDAKTGKEISLIKQEGMSFGKIAFSSDGNTLAMATGIAGRAEVQLWNITENRIITAMPSISGISSIFFSDDGTKLACAGYFGRVNVWEIGNDYKLNLITDTRLNEESWNSSRLVKLSPDRRFLAVTTDDWQNRNFQIHIYNATNGGLLHTLTAHKRWIKSIAFSPDSKTLVSGDEYESIHTWDTETGDLKDTMKWRRGTSTHSLAYSPNGDYIASGHRNGVRLWYKNTDGKHSRSDAIGQYKNIKTFTKHKDYVHIFHFSPDGKIMLTGSKDGTVRAWDTTTANLQYTCTGFLEGIRDIALSESGDNLITLNQPHNPPGTFQHRRWDVNTGDHLSSAFLRHVDATSLVVSPDGETCVTHGVSGRCVLWDIADKSLKRLSNFSMQDFPRSGLNVRFAFSLDGTMLAAGGEDHSVHVWNIIDKKNPPQLQFTANEHTEIVWSVAFSPDGTKLATGGRDQEFRIWNVASARTIQTFRGHSWRVNCFAFSPNNQVLASGSYELFLWHVQSGKQLKHIKQHKNAIIEALTFSPDGNILIIAARDGLKLYDMHTDRLTTINQDYTSILNLSVDNNILISGSESGEILVWDWEKVQQRLMNN